MKTLDPLAPAVQSGLPAASVPRKSGIRWLYPVAAVLACTIAAGPLLYPDYFWGAHDARHSVYFLVEFERAFRDGVWYPRWAPDFAFGYGYPIFNIYGPLTFYLGELFRGFGADFVTAVKLVFGLGLALSALSMFVLASDLFGRRAGLLSAILYVYAPYRLVDLYVRGALAEHFAFVFFPLVLWSGRRAVLDSARYGFRRTRTQAYVAATGASLAAMVLTHNAIALLFLPVALAYWAFTIWGLRREQRHGAGVRAAVLSLVAAAVLALGLAAIFWLPLIAEYSAVRVDQWITADYDLRAHFVYPHQLLSPLWGYGISEAGPNDQFSLQIGIVGFVLTLFALAAAFGLRERGRPLLRLSGRRRRDLGFFAVAALGASLFMLPLALPAWEILRISSVVQFPWRFLSVSTLALSVAGGASALLVRRQPAALVALVTFCGVAVLIVYPSLGTPEEIFRPPDTPVSLAGLMKFEQSSGELVGLTRWNTEKPVDSPLFYVYLQGVIPDDKIDRTSLASEASVRTTRHSTTLDEISISSPNGTPVRVFTQFYPGWRAYVDGFPVDIQPSDRLGLITVLAPPGDHTVLIRFEDTWSRWAGGIASVLSVFVLLAWGVRIGVQRLRGQPG